MKAPAFWSARSPRERTAIAVGAALVAGVLLVVLAWLPLERLRTRLAADLPALRASVAEMRAQAAEVQRLRTQPAGATPSATPLSALIAAGTLTQGLPGARLAALDGKRLRLTVADASWTRLSEWVAGAHSLHGLVVEAATVEALAAAGRVKAELVLSAP